MYLLSADTTSLINQGTSKPSDIVIFVLGSAFGGVGIWILERIIKRWCFKIDERKILKFFDQNNQYNFYPAYRIASGVHLTEDRIEFVCGTSKKFVRNQKERQTWRLNQAQNSN